MTPDDRFFVRVIRRGVVFCSLEHRSSREFAVGPPGLRHPCKQRFLAAG
jgi:hypothetical protein